MNENAPNLLDRPGIFKARPFDWSVQPSNASKAVAISIGFLIESQYEDGDWISWAEYEPHQIRGWWYVIGKNGQVNTTAVEQLTKSLGWNGDLKAIKANNAPDVVVQITVRSEEFEGKTRFKAGWMNPGDHVPDFGGASEEDVAKLSVQFGSLLRAAAASVAKSVPAGVKKPLPAAKPARKPVPKTTDGPVPGPDRPVDPAIDDPPF